MIISLFQQSGGGGSSGDKIGVAPPTISSTGLVYDGSEKSPTIGDYNTNAINVSYTPQINAGVYNVVLSLRDKSKYAWLNTYDSENQTEQWAIAKAAGTSSLDKNYVELGEGESDTVTVTRDGDGEILAVSSNTAVATVSVSGNVVTIEDGGTEGTATVSISVAAGTNYEAIAAKTVAVEVSHGPEIVTWASGTYDKIEKMLKAHYDGKIDISDYWNLGDTRNITLSAMTATEVGESHISQQMGMVIIDFKCDDLTTSIGSISKAAITIQQKKCLTDGSTYQVDSSYQQIDSELGYMNSTYTNAGTWPSCKRRTWCNSIYYNAIPNGLKSLIKQVKKVTAQQGKSYIYYTSNDYCWLLSEFELIGQRTSGQAYSGEGNQYEYLKTWTNRCYQPRYNLNSGYNSGNYWLRSPAKDEGYSFVYGYGASTSIAGANNLFGIVPAFCI